MNNPNTIKFRSISKTLSLGLILALMVVAVLNLSVNYILSSRKAQSELEKKATEYIASLTDSLKVPLWNYTEETIDAIGASYSQNEFIARLVIVDQDGSIIFSKEKPDELTAVARSSRIVYDNQYIGRVDIALSSRYYSNVNQQLFWSFSINILLMIGTLLILTGVLLRQFLKKPMAGFIDMVNAYAAGDSRAFKPGIPYVEFAPLIKVLDEMGDKIESQVESLQLIQHAVDSSSVATFWIDPAGRITYVNQAACRSLGYSKEDLLKQSIIEIDPFLSSDQWHEEFAQLKTRGSSLFESAQRRKDGTIFPVEIAANYLRFKNRHYLFAFVSDITLRKSAESEIRKLNEDLEKRVEARTEELKRLSEAIEQSPASVMITDIDGTIEYVNPKFSETTGYAADEVVGRLPNSLKSGDFPDSFYQDLWDTILAGKIWKGDLTNRKKNGEKFWETASISPIKNEEGRITHFVAVNQDITARKQMEEELFQAKESAEVATRAKSDFLANMSHEIRTPMNAIIGMTHLCLGTELGAKQRDYIEKVHHSAKSLLGIINEILDFSKIEAGKLEMESIPFHIDEVLDNLGNLIALKAQEKGLEVIFDIHPELPRTLVGDPLRLGQVLLNLAGNAVKFTDRGEIVIRVAPAAATEKEAEISFAMQDTGIGMSPEQVGKLFQSFSQADTSTTRKYGGTGLGLAISQKLVEMMKGRIWVESKSGEGTTYTFTAKFGHSPDVEQTLRTNVPPGLERLKVLVVDDVAGTRDMLQTTLESFSFRVTCADSGAAAITALETAAPEDPYRLVLLDWKMPGMDGIEALRRIRQIEKLPVPPMIIMVTAYRREALVRQIEEAGLEVFLVKPFTPSTLLDTIMGALGDRSGIPRPGQTEVDWAIRAVEDLRGAKVLLTEDNKINQQVAQDLLTQAGLTVTVANNGREAVDMIAQHDFDAVLMDIQMPEMDGYEATRRIRKWEEKQKTQSSKLKAGNELKAQSSKLGEEKLKAESSKLKGKDSNELSAFSFQLSANAKRLPIIAMTANALANDREKCLAAGMDDHVAKPIEPGKLFSTLKKWIEPRPRTRSREADYLPVGMDGIDLLPDSLAGIDMETGLRRVGGNRKLFHKLLVEFYRDHGRDPAAIHAALVNGDLRRAQRIAHTMKGLSGSIGADDLQRDAEILDSAFRAGHEDLYFELLSRLEDSLAPVIRGLEVLAADHGPEESAAADGGPLNQKTVLPHLDDLQILLEEMDPAAEELAKALQAQFGTAAHQDLFQTLSGQVGEFEFEAALETLDRLRDNLNPDT